MSYLLLPDDEQNLVRYLSSEAGLDLLLDALAPRQRSGGASRRLPHVGGDPLAALPNDLPPPVRPREPGTVPRSLLFWSPGLGPLVALGDPGREQDAKSRVGLALTRESADEAGYVWEDVIDQERSPVIRWLRCSWRDDGHLTPGLLQGMAAPLRAWPQQLVRTYRSVERWLRRDAVRIDPFEHCDGPPATIPRDRRPFTVWARPAAASWVAGGGRVWPWTG